MEQERKQARWRPKNWDVFQIREDNLSTCNAVELWIEAGADAVMTAFLQYLGNNYQDKHGNIYIDFVEWGKLRI